MPDHGKVIMVNDQLIPVTATEMAIVSRFVGCGSVAKPKSWERAMLCCFDVYICAMLPVLKHVLWDME